MTKFRLVAIGFKVDRGQSLVVPATVASIQSETRISACSGTSFSLLRDHGSESREIG